MSTLRFKQLHLVVLILAPLWLAGLAPTAKAAFHLWQIKEAFSNADGSVQFIEMFDSFTSENFITGFTLSTNSDGAIKTFTFASNPMGESAGKHLLLATPGFAALPGAVTPDYTLPSTLFFNPNAASISISFSGSGDTMTFTGAVLPKDGVNSLTDTDLYLPQNLVSGVNSPTNFNNQSGSINLAPPPAGDYNGNHGVDGADYVVWRNTLNQPVSPSGSGADGNNSGIVDAGDFTFWRARFGNTSGSASGSVVPEPAVAFLALSWLFALGWRSKKRALV